MDKARPIIIVKKNVGHSSHHGGAWKVAYADFVTAMIGAVPFMNEAIATRSTYR